MPRFVVLRHEMPSGSDRPSHFDFMFEFDGALRTWAVDRLPSAGGGAVRATPLPPHRLAYLQYEGPVAGNRGTVHRVAAGQYESVADTEGRVEMQLDSPEISGRIVLEDQQVWLL